jgi:A/G-specific adenine glycosylase
MPWRKSFRPPHSLAPAALAQRAYEVWISEVMLQQTRVQTVVGYWERWMARWPTIQDLAAAGEEEVLGVWAGLGYYSRAGRVWRAAGGVVRESGGLLPGSVEGLMRVEGIGRYTAGAVAAIVFGVPAPMVDGNVLRVLSRQMGVLGDVKGDRRVVALLWEAAEWLVKAVAADGEEEVSERPGLWGQALMELGSTVCTPKPNCAVCPITATCRAHAEGLALAANKRAACEVTDMEDLCTLCAPYEQALEDGEEGGVEETKSEPNRREGRLSRFFAAPQATGPPATTVPDARALKTISSHARKFPLKKPKKKVREEETLVCAIRRSSDGQLLINRRPEKGLLGGMWELPSHTLPDSNKSTVMGRKTKAVDYVAGLVAAGNARSTTARAAVSHSADLGSVPWLFSHLKLTMHVHLFEVGGAGGVPELRDQARWATMKEIDMESM